MRKSQEIKPRIQLRYEWEEIGSDVSVCVLTYEGKEYKIREKLITELAEIYSFPVEVREDIFFWAKMRHNPD